MDVWCRQAVYTVWLNREVEDGQCRMEDSVSPRTHCIPYNSVLAIDNAVFVILNTFLKSSILLFFSFIMGGARQDI